jgi:hypothetical protein
MVLSISRVTRVNASWVGRGNFEEGALLSAARGISYCAGFLLSVLQTGGGDNIHTPDDGVDDADAQDHSRDAKSILNGPWNRPSGVKTP